MLKLLKSREAQLKLRLGRRVNGKFYIISITQLSNY